MKNQEIKVEVTAMNANLKDEATRKSMTFGSFKKAYSYYNELVDSMNLTNAEYSNEVEMNHTAGGIGFDFRVELICE
jgi:hypothetical protein